MCRNIKQLHNFDPPATDDEVHAAALQYVRKISGTTKPSKANEAVFEQVMTAVRAHDWPAMEPYFDTLQIDIAMRGMKRAINEFAHGRLDEEGADRRARDSMRGAEIKEGIRAFSEKRPPKF